MRSELGHTHTWVVGDVGKGGRGCPCWGGRDDTEGVPGRCLLHARSTKPKVSSARSVEVHQIWLK